MADIIEKKFLGTEGVQQLITNTRGEIAAAEKAAKDYADGLADNYDAAGTAATKVQELENGKVKALEQSLAEGGATALAIEAAKQAGIDAASTLENGQVKTNKEAIGTLTSLKTDAKTDLVAALNEVHDLAETNKTHIGTMDSLETTNKADLVSALNEVRNAVSAGGTAAAITMEEKTSGLGDGILKAYTIKQGTNTVGTINIPKDMVVQSGEVVVNPDGQAAGTYIKLVLANATNDVIYVNVGTLVDIYTAKASAAQVQLAINSDTREISASIVEGSITATELAADAVTTVKIADGNVTKAKLSTELQGSIDNLEASLAEGGATYNAIEAAKQAGINAASTLETGKVATLEGKVSAIESSIGKDGETDRKIAAAQKAADDAATAVTALENGIVATHSGQIADIEKSLATGGATANAIEAAKQAGINAASTLENGKVATLEGKVAALESVSYVEITATEIDNMFNAD